MKNKQSEFKKFKSQLKKTDQARILDTRAFEDYNAGILTREELFEGIKLNNKMKFIGEVDMDEFERWVHKLGW